MSTASDATTVTTVAPSAAAPAAAAPASPLLYEASEVLQYFDANPQDAASLVAAIGAQPPVNSHLSLGAETNTLAAKVASAAGVEAGVLHRAVSWVAEHGEFLGGLLGKLAPPASAAPLTTP